ncbi:MAG: hypothetical protein QGI45_02280 [Myxococcota bacterium]|jgi:hypothetical protein|nr:hypothetical protein [Myxococcota bacterium]
MKSSLTIIARIFVEAQKTQAQSIAQTLKKEVQGITKPPAIEDYWKEPTWQEITLEVVTEADTPENALSTLATQLGQGWSFGSEEATAFAIWSAPEDGSFIVEHVRFANLEIDCG